MRLGRTFAIAFAAGTVAYVVGALLRAPDAPAPVLVEREASPTSRDTSSLPGDTEHAFESSRVPAFPPLPRKDPDAPENVGAPQQEKVEDRARRLAAHESMSREDARALLEEALAGRLADRELSPEDYERLTDAVMRLRAAQRVLRRIDPSTASAEELVRRRTDVVDALAEIEEVTGVAPSDLGGLSDLGDSPAGVSPDDDENPDEIIHEPIIDDPR